jgi:hypothetical protein
MTCENQRDRAELLRARVSIQNAIRYLRGGKTDAFHLVEPTLSFASGAQCAIEWMLSTGTSGELFADYLAGLERIEDRLIREAGGDG